MEVSLQASPSTSSSLAAGAEGEGGGSGDSIDGANAATSSTSSRLDSTSGGGGGASWQAAAEACEVVEEDLRAIYSAALEESKFDSAELAEVHTLREKAQLTLDPRSPMVRTVLRDMRQLQEASLVHADSAIFVRQVSGERELAGVSGQRIRS